MKWLEAGLALVVSAGCTGGTQGTTSGSGATSAASSSGAGTQAFTSSGSGGGGSSTGTTSGGTASGGNTGTGTTTGAADCFPPCEESASCIASAGSSGFCQCDPGFSSCVSPLGTMSCVDEQIDSSNCGGCGSLCPGASRCVGGGCVCQLSSCPLDDGGSLCVDELSDPFNCGGCDSPCSPPTIECLGGMCSCPVEDSLCYSPDAGALVCFDTSQDTLNCGACGYDCLTSYAIGSGCRFAMCVCDPEQDQICAEVPSGEPPACDCSSAETPCPTPRFATDIYPLLAQQSGAFGCSASGCHSGGSPAGALAFLDDGGQPDAGMAYAELTGTGAARDNGGGVPFCDAGSPSGAPSTQCACASRVVPGLPDGSILIGTLTNNLPCDSRAMPLGDAGEWVPLSLCAQQLFEQWVSLGGKP